MTANIGIVSSGFAITDVSVLQPRQEVMGWSWVDGSSGITYTRFQSNSLLGYGSGGGNGSADWDLNDYYEFLFSSEPGIHTLRLTTLTKNPSAVTYNMALHHIGLRRTGA